MPVIRSASEADFLFEVEGFDGELRVLGFDGDEGISRLFGFALRLACEDNAIDIDSIVGQPATLTIRHDVGERKVHGIVNRFEQASTGTDFTPYFAQLVPEVWLLTQRYGCRIHQNISVQDIIQTVLTDAGIADDRFRFALSGYYGEREYCVEYRESDWNFISRLLEEEGIFYFFEHTDEGCTLVMADSDTANEPIESPDTVPFREASGTVAEEEAVVTFRYSQQVRPGKVTYRDYYFENPTLNLEKDDAADRDDALEVYDYPGRYIDPDAGQNRATVTMETIQTRRIVAQGQSLCRRFIPGGKFTLEEYPRSDFNREYLLIWVSHTGTQPHGEDAVGGEFEYNNEFRCIPSDVPFRPARRTPRPVVEGTQTAIVTGPSGEEIYPDEHGRVKVQFHWDREGQNDENTSCWIRVSQLWAGKNWGAMWIPRIGHEVIVDFLEGNPDKPIIIGRVYHGDNQPPYSLPTDKTKSTIKSDSSKGGGGSNEFRFEDKKGSEEIFLHGQKDWNITIENNKTQSIGRSETLKVGTTRAKEVGKDQSELIGENKSIKVNKNHTENVGEDVDIVIGKNESVTIGKKLNLKIGSDADEAIGGNINTAIGGNSKTSVGQNLSLDVGGAASAQINGGLSVNADKKTDITAKDNVTVSSDSQIELKSGSASITLKKNGDITIKGGKITIKASKDMILKGSKIAEN